MEHIIIPDDKELFFISDFHFCHQKVCRGYENHFDLPRDYETVDEMNDAIVKSVQNIGRNAVLVFLGDFCLNVPADKLRETFYKFADQFNVGQMIMILGNHDHVLQKKLKDDNITFHPRAIVEHSGNVFFCQHKGFDECPYYLAEEKETLDMDKLTLVHGHTHSQSQLSKVGEMMQNCVCFDVANRPIHSNELYPANTDPAEDEFAKENLLDQLIDDTIHHVMKVQK